MTTKYFENSFDKWGFTMVIVFSVILFSWVAPTYVEALDHDKRQECLDGYIDLVYVRGLQNVTKQEAHNFGFWFIDNCDYDYSEKEWFDRVDELTQHSNVKVIRH